MIEIQSMIKFKQKLMQQTMHLEQSPRVSLKQKILFICDHNKNFHLANTQLLIFFIFYQIIPLNFILERVAQQTNSDPSTTSFLLNNFNKISLLVASSIISDFQLQVYLLIAFLLLLLFTAVCYSTFTIQIERRTRLRKDTLKKLEIIQQISFLVLMFQLPIGVFCVNYLIFLVDCQEWYLIMVPIVILGLSAITVYLIEEFSNENNYNYSKIVYLSRVYVRYQGAMAVFKFIVKIGIVLLIQNSSSTTILFLCTALMLVIDLVELELFIQKVRFLEGFTIFLVEIKLVLCIIIEIFCLIVMATKSELLIDNLFICILPTTALAVLSLHKHQNYDRQQLLLTDISAISNEEDATKVMIVYLKFFEDKNANKVFLLALVQVHKSKCEQCQCICKTTQSKSMNHSAWVDFFHKFVLLTLANICCKFPRSLKVIAVYLNFKIHFMHSFSTIHFAITNFMKQYGRQLTSSDQFAFEQIKRDVEENTDLFNQNSLTVDLQIVFKQQLLQKQLRKLIDNINVNNYKKYSMIQQQFCKLNKVEILCDEITRDIRKIQSHWSTFRKSASFNMKIYEVFLVYNQSIIMSKSTFSDVKTEMITKLQAVRGLRGVSAHNLAKYVHNKNTCVVESQVIEDAIGHITNVSHRCENVFRMSKEKMKGNNIHNIMTSFMAVSHEKMAREWMQAERLSNILKKIISVCYVGANNNCFQGSIFIKIKSTGSLLTFYSILIKQNEEDYLVLNQEMIIEGFGRRLQSEKVFNLACISTKFKDFCDLNLAQQLDTKSSVKKKILLKDRCVRTSSSLGDSKSSRNISKRQYVEGDSYFHQCSVLINMQRLRNYTYYSIKFLQINKIIRRRTVISHPPKLKSQTHIAANQEVFQQIKIPKAISSYKTIDKDDGDEQVQVELLGENMSVSSCFTGGELNIKLNKIFIISKEKVVDSTTIEDERVPATTLLIVLLSLLLIFAAVGVCQIFNAGFSTYQNFLTANGAVSNTYNLMEIVYNDIMTAGLYCDPNNPLRQPQRCRFLLQSGLHVAQEFYALIVDDFRNYLVGNPSLTSLHYYEVFEMNATFQLDSQNISLAAREFMQQFYYLLQQTGQQMKLHINNHQLKAQQKLKLLLANWQTLRTINHNAVDFYNSAGLNQITLITKYMTVVIAFMYVLMVLLILSWRSFKNYIEDKKQNIARVHGIITSSQCEELKKAVVVSFNSEIFEEPTRVIKPVGKPSYLTKNQFIYHKDKTFRYFLAPFFLLLTALNLPLLINMAQILPNSQQLIQVVSDLLSSEKLVLENYQQLKNAYFFGNSSQFDFQIKALIQQMSQQIQPKINAVAKDIRGTLSSDPNFSPNLNKLFNDDVCSLNNQYNYFNKYCGQGNSFGILPQGLISTATLIQRQTYSTLLQFSQNLFSNSSTLDKQLNGTVFYLIDSYQVYLSRVYKKIQNQIIASLQLLINQTYSKLILFSVLQIIALALGILIWMVSVRREKHVLSNLYGVVLQFPQALLQDNRWHIKTIEQNLKFDL